MTLNQALTTAIEAMIDKKQSLAVNANLFKHGALPSAATAAIHYDRLVEAINILSSLISSTKKVKRNHER